MKSIYNSTKQKLENKLAGIGALAGFLLAVGIISFGLVSLGLMPYHLEWFCIIMYIIVAICVSVRSYVTASDNIVYCRAFRTDLSSRKIKKELYLYTHGLIEVIGLLLGAFLIGFLAKYLSINFDIIFIASYLMVVTGIRYILISKKLKSIKERYPTTHKKGTCI